MATKYDVVVKNLKTALSACGSEAKIQETKSLIGRALSSVLSAYEKKSVKQSISDQMVEESRQNSKKWWDDIKKGLESKLPEQELKSE